MENNGKWGNGVRHDNNEVGSVGHRVANNVGSHVGNGVEEGWAWAYRTMPGMCVRVCGTAAAARAVVSAAQQAGVNTVRVRRNGVLRRGVTRR